MLIQLFLLYFFNIIISENQYKDTVDGLCAETMEARCFLPSPRAGYFNTPISFSLKNSDLPLDSFLLEKVDRPIF